MMKKLLILPFLFLTTTALASGQSQATQDAENILGRQFDITGYSCPDVAAMDQVLRLGLVKSRTKDLKTATSDFSSVLLQAKCQKVKGHFILKEAFREKTLDLGNGPEIWYELLVLDKDGNNAYLLVGVDFE